MVSVEANPFGLFKNECISLVEDALFKLGIKGVKVNVEFPPPAIRAELAFPCFSIARVVKENPRRLAESIVEKIDIRRLKFIEKIEVAGGGYVNFYVNYPALAYETFKSAECLDETYGHLKVETPLRIVVEHTSANPIHPLHIGAARNAVLGDTLARLLRARGHNVKVHFYINDVGLQVAVAAYGYDKIGRVKPVGKPDHFIGLIYAMTNCIVEISDLKRKLNKLDEMGVVGEDRVRIANELSEWIGIAKDLRDRNPSLFDKLLETISLDDDPKKSIAQLDLQYELGEKDAVELFRKLCLLCIDGFKETFERANIDVESWDWESDIVWSSRVKSVIDALKRTSFTYFDGGALIFDAEKAAITLGLKKDLGVSELYEVPKLTLVRSDGRTLYPTRDIAYTLWQFEHFNADKVIHVIGVDQTLPQLQLRIALATLGKMNYALNMIHFAYELVHLPGFKMSSRRGRYVEFDRILGEAIERAEEEVRRRSPKLDDETVRNIGRMIGVGAVRYALLSVTPSRKMTFTWERVLNFEQNSAPFIQYAHARACNILAKVDALPEEYDPSLLNHRLERELILKVSMFPEVVADAADNLRPEILTEYANFLALTFNSFYDALPVLKAKPLELRNARLHLVNVVRITLRNTLSLMGISAPSRM
ncbi:MAG: arginine--tRNA ligase [archaeon GB-1867-035]|nr:arginine--tRNA ligase [Candidatus Culexmicrobium profundum]